MSPQLQAIIDKAEKLPISERMELVSVITKTLQSKNEPSSGFWQSKSVTQLADEQKIEPASKISDVKSDFWPKEESADEFNEFINTQRKNDRLTD